MWNRAWATIRKYGWYSIIIGTLMAGILFILFKNLLVGRKTKVSKEDSILKDFIQKKQTELKVAETEAAVKIAIARTQEIELKKELEATVQIEDTEERLAALIRLRAKALGE